MSDINEENIQSILGVNAKHRLHHQIQWILCNKSVSTLTYTQIHAHARIYTFATVNRVRKKRTRALSILTIYTFFLFISKAVIAVALFPYFLIIGTDEDNEYDGDRNNDELVENNKENLHRQ